jgi:hypothetical protein
VERSIKFTATGLPVVMMEDAELEGEESPEGLETATEPESEDKLAPPPAVPAVPNLPQAIPTPPPVPETRPIRNRKPSQYVRDVLDGKGTADNLPKGVQPPTTIAEADEPAEEHGELTETITAIAMAAEMSDALGLEPRSLAEATRSPTWPQWKEAMQEEHTALETHKTWRLEKPPPGANIDRLPLGICRETGCHWYGYPLPRPSCSPGILADTWC